MKPITVVVFQVCFMLVFQDQCGSVFGQMMPLLQKGSDAFIDPTPRNDDSKTKKRKKESGSKSATTADTIPTTTLFNINSLRSRGESSKSSKKAKKHQTSMMTNAANATDSTMSSSILDRLRAKKSKRGRDDDDDDDDPSHLKKSQVKQILSLFYTSNSTFDSFFQKKGKKEKYADDDDDDPTGLAKWFGKKEKREKDDDDDADDDDDSKSGKKKKSFNDFFGGESGKSEKKRKYRGTGAPTTTSATVRPPTLLPISIPIPTVRPVTTAPTGPTPAPTTAAPSGAPSEARSCSPTVGPCLRTVANIQAAFDASTGGDTIAICATADPIAVETALVLRQPNTTLCCFNETSVESCTLQSQGSDRTLDVLTASVRLQDLAFENGVGTAGGNAVIDGEGDHIVDGCEFRSGEASRFGGNLFVQADGGSLHILDSTFADGVAAEFGGGVYVINANELTVENSVFQGNNVTDEDSSGGGIFMVFDNSTAPGQVAAFRNLEFRENEADIGGGFFATQLGEMPRLDVIGCTFVDNQGRRAAGAGAIAQSLDNFDFRLMTSVGIDNAAPVCQDLLGFFDDSVEPECIAAGSMYPP